MHSLQVINVKPCIPVNLLQLVDNRDLSIITHQGIPALPNTYPFSPLSNTDPHFLEDALLFSGHRRVGYLGIELSTRKILQWDLQRNGCFFANSSLIQYCESVDAFAKGLPFGTNADETEDLVVAKAEALRRSLLTIDSESMHPESFWQEIIDSILDYEWSSEVLDTPID